MKEYKIIKQKAKLRNSDKDFEIELNNYAREGWHVITGGIMSSSTFFKVILEREKNR
ncbi:DUF4177 domain-containing protein [Cellulophaga sp. F20128]|uniref:DUF4177 domain-containing protein n=1 Tax=Cellulophaga sp. F20128 TaxID=2926413 RepID=UPI001FF513F8|nr:DUF4177 domain-containing protein [Cellulophaga sp. F20128]MCK0158387.1 DUF4177 domain-containing protein [Cellulophaga sp. F20128]